MANSEEMNEGVAADGVRSYTVSYTMVRALALTVNKWAAMAEFAQKIKNV